MLLSQSPCRAEQGGGALRIDLVLGPGQQARADFVHPQNPGSAMEAYRSASFDESLAWFRGYWDCTLGSAAEMEVPEPRVNRLYKAVLAQIFINGDGDWIRKHLPLLRQCAAWTIAQRRRTMTDGDAGKPLHWGLLPKWSYGGDISEVQCYPLYANYCCWRGLTDTAWLLNELGDSETARRYAEEAGQYRAAIDRAVDASHQKDRRPAFLPLRLYADRPDEQMDYYQLFAGCILDLEPFGKGSRHFRWIADFLEADNRTFCFLPRFRRDVGPGELDALYGKGYLLAKLQEDDLKEYLLGFYAFLAFNMDHETFASRETNLLYASDLHARSACGIAACCSYRNKLAA